MAHIYLQTQQLILETQQNIFQTQQVNICKSKHKIGETQQTFAKHIIMFEHKNAGDARARARARRRGYCHHRQTTLCVRGLM